MAAPYASADDLAAAVRVTVSAKNQAQLDACVAAASEEIDHELDRAVDDPLPDPAPALVHETCIARGVEWWKASDAAFGALGFDGAVAVQTPRDAFARHAANLVPYKRGFGVA